MNTVTIPQPGDEHPDYLFAITDSTSRATVTYEASTFVLRKINAKPISPSEYAVSYEFGVNVSAFDKAWRECKAKICTPERTVLRRYELPPLKRCRVWEWVALPYAVLIGILAWKAGLFG